MKPVVVVDASVSIKWFVPFLPEEADVPDALGLLEAYAEDRVTLYQPPIWRAEVLAVLARVSPSSAARHALHLLSFDHESADSFALYQKAVELSIQLNHHLFDTIYHAAALLHPNAVFVTADDRYLKKGEHLGRLLALPLWRNIFH
jgi:predicted nucleic acid-binding protein